MNLSLKAKLAAGFGSLIVLTTCVLFPLEGDPIVITWAPLRVKRAQYSVEQGNRLWIEDYRVAANGKAVADVVQEMGLAQSRMGIVGLRSIAPTEQYGSIPAAFWMDFSGALPRLQFRDFSEEFSHLSALGLLGIGTNRPADMLPRRASSRS